MNSEKPNCYECKFRKDIPGNAHSECCHPSLSEKIKVLSVFSLGMGLKSNAMQNLNVSGNAHGIKNGWFLWPLNFDPVWLKSCNGFEKEKNENTTQKSEC